MLVGHSDGGVVITCVADRVPDRIAALVYMDAFVPRDGESAYDVVHGDWRKWYVEGAAGDGFSMAPLPIFDARATAHPLPTLLRRASLTGAVEAWPAGHDVLREAPERFLAVLKSASRDKPGVGGAA